MDQIDPFHCPSCASPQPSMHPAVSGGGEVTELCADPFHGPPPGALLTPPGVIVKSPQEVAAEAARLVPYEKADRTPEGNLKELHAFAANQLQVNPDLLVSLAGEICEHGAVLVLARNELETAEIMPVGWVIVSYDSRYPGFKVQHRGTERMAREAYAHRVQVLS